MKRILLSLAAAAVSAAVCAEESSWELSSLLPFPASSDGGEWQSSALESLYQTGGGFAAGGKESAQPVSDDPTYGQPAFRLEHGSWGFGVSELRADFSIGDYCTDYPEGTIDWAATETAITNSAAYRDGYLFYVDSASSPDKRVLFTRGGEVSVPWKLEGGVDATQIYTVGHMSSARPYRIFWTEHPFSGPRIDLGAHPDVRLLGDPAIVKPVYESSHTSAQTGVSNIVRGVVFDATAKVLKSYCRVVNETTREYDGPVGQFVLAYYDSGRMDNLVATIVVEACPPDVTVINASVGDELRPTGGGYNIEGLESEIRAGDDVVPGDAVAPYLYKHKGDTNWSPKHGAVFAIAPTDSTTTKTGESAPWRADIYWKAPDPLDVLWPFEEDWYEISWSDDVPNFIVSGDPAAPGLPIIAATNLTASVCACQTPANIAKADSNGSISATEAGRFTIKLVGDDNVWFQPVRARLRTDAEVAMTNAADWTVGREITLLGGAAAGNTERAALSASGDLPGYIYEAASTGRRNWNPRLYRAPKQDSQSDSVDDGTETNAFARLVSAIYPVNTSSTPIEVWWSGHVSQYKMGAGLKIPCVVQRYDADWPDARDLQTIVIASQKGSDGALSGASESALYLNATNSTGVLADGDNIAPGSTSGLTFGFWVNPSPGGAANPQVTEGFLTTLYDANEPSVVSFRLIGTGEDPSVEICTSADAGMSWEPFATLPAPKDEWTHIALALGPVGEGGARPARVFTNAVAVEAPETITARVLTNSMSLAVGAWSVLVGRKPAPAATGVALDGISAWSAQLTEQQLVEIWQKVGGSAEAALTRQFEFTFDAARDLVQLQETADRFVFDTLGYRVLRTNGILKMSPGAPALTSGLVTSDSGISPQIYFENNASADGFNPNDEHAFLREGPSGWIVHALRCDLSSGDGSDPLVLVQYASGGKGAMRSFGVVLTNEVYSALGSTRKAGLAFTPPHPLDILDNADNERSFAVTVSSAPTNSFGEVTEDAEVVYVDRNKRMWARRDGVADAYYYYAVQPGFWFPGVETQPAAGTLVPWLSRVATNTADAIVSAPMPWRWDVTWPADAEIPKMRVAQTLTTASEGLPEVWSASSMAVAFPAPLAGKEKRERVVRLIDPTVAQSVDLSVKSSFPDEYGFTLGPAGTTQLRTGKYYFTGTPPAVADRFYVDAANGKMCLVGKYVEKKSGGSYLQVNVLQPEERAVLRELCKGSDDAKSKWRAAVDSLAKAEVVPNTVSREALTLPDGSPTNSAMRIATAYKPVDHYALVASGEGSGYVTIVENDSADTTMVAPGSTISMHVIKVLPELYAGGLTVVTDPLNKLSEQLTIAYTSPFGSAADDFEFEWRRIETQTDGAVPTNYPDWRVYGTATNGLTSILLGARGADLKDLQNMYYAMRYRAAKDATAHAVTGDTWSEWCGPTLAEGWVQRVLNAVTPFAQRCADFTMYKSDLAYSMLEQIGAPYRGDVALNNDNLNNIGLLELYRTVLNKAERMSLDLGAKTDAGVNKQLLLAASRIAELYGILGDEAYSDAKNPTICQMFSGTEYDSDSLSSSVFCFQNQLPTLLDEELALLRGRTSAVAPNMTTYPCYNRLVWNFTKGVTEGEVAYVNNYMIIGGDGEISQEQAAAQYPQGHGDAYGHYLSMLKSFYHLARNPYFDWYATMTEMLIGDYIVNVDYFDEEKFAEAAGSLAQTALDAMDLTARKAWRESDGAAGAGYCDADARQAFGYGEWAVRGGYGALCNWAVVNSLLPTNDAPVDAAFQDRGVSRINRSTASALAYLPSALRSIQQKLDAIDSGRNPLGFSDNAIPFDIEPTEMAGETATALPHFEQFLVRTEKALDNAKTVLDHAHQFGSRLAQISLREGEDVDTQEETEAEYVKNLVAIYGTPLSGDIGPGGTYAQGYEGPDIYHYMYIDLAPYGLDSIDSALTKKVVAFNLENAAPVVNAWNLDYVTGSVFSVVYTLTPDGIPQAPKASGRRRTEGTLQAAYRDFIAAYSKLKRASSAYDASVDRLRVQRGVAREKLRQAGTDLAFDEILGASKIVKAGVDLATGRTIDALEAVSEGAEMGESIAFKSTPKIVGAGLTVNVDPSAVVGAVAGATAGAVKASSLAGIYGAKTIAAAADFYLTSLETGFKMVTDGFDYYNAEVESWERLKDAASDTHAAANDLVDAYAELTAAEQAYRSIIAEGDALRSELAMKRRHWANTATSLRYADMYNRIQRNNALTKYTAAFDTAQRYVYMLARIYDYETGLMSTDARSGDAFMRNIIAARSLGERDVATEVNSTLWDAVSRMSANWDVLKGRLGINNPEKTTKWFSLRYSLFRISPEADGDDAWRATLASCWKDDILSDPDFRRYCQPPASDTAPVVTEPGLVIKFSTTINLAENLFGKSLLGGEATFSSSDYAVKLQGTAVRFAGYGKLAVSTPNGLSKDPNVYLVPVGRDYMRTPVGTSRQTLAFRVLDEVMPIPYDTNEIAGLLKDPNWVSSLYGGDDSATIRRHSTMSATTGEEATSTRLVGRSVWNDRWLLVIPASSLSSDRVNALKTFINGLDTDKDGKLDVPGVSDIELGFKTYSRSGN